MRLPIRKSPWRTTAGPLGPEPLAAPGDPVLDRGMGLTDVVELLLEPGERVRLDEERDAGGGIAWMRASSSASRTSRSGRGSRTIRRPIVSPSSQAVTNASRPSRSPT